MCSRCQTCRKTSPADVCEHEESPPSLIHLNRSAVAGTETCLDTAAAVAALRRAKTAGSSVRQRPLYRRGPIHMDVLVFEPNAHTDEDQVAHGLVSLHLLDGAMTVTTRDQVHHLTAGAVLALAPCVPFRLAAGDADSALLLTVHQERFHDTGL